MTELTDRIVALRDRLADARKGYAQAADSADEPELGALFQRAEGIHADAIAQIEPLLPDDAPSEGGTLIGALTEMIVSARSAITGDASVLPGMLDGQLRVLQACDEARRAATADPAAMAALSSVRPQLAALRDDLEAWDREHERRRA